MIVSSSRKDTTLSRMNIFIAPLEVELDRESLKYLGMVENILHFNGTSSHEIVLIYDGTLKDSGLYDQAVITGQEVDGEEIHAMWKNITDFGEGKSILYPTDLVEMLGTRASHDT